MNMNVLIVRRKQIIFKNSANRGCAETGWWECVCSAKMQGGDVAQRFLKMVILSTG